MFNLILKTILNTYSLLFARVFFFKFNQLIYLCSLRGLGIMNYESESTRGEKNFLTKYLGSLPDDLYVVDVGANVGNYSRLIMQISPSVHLFAFEPHPKSFAKLKSLSENKNFRAVNAAVGSASGVIPLYDYEADNGSEHASLFKDVIENIHHASSVAHMVNLIKLDDYFIDNNIQYIDLVKIDTEGNELEVLLGMKKIIDDNNVGAIQFEFNEMNVSSRVYFRDFWNLMPNYDFYRLLQDGMIPIKNYTTLFTEIFVYQNIVAINKNSELP